YTLRCIPAGCDILASQPRGALYGAYALADRFAQDRRLPQSLEITSAPYFPIREWWSAAFQANFNLPLGGAFDRPIEEISAIVSRTIHEAPRYGINTLQLMGRAGEGGIDLSWFLRYDEFPKLRARVIGWGIDRRTEEIRKLAREAHRFGLEFLLWDHELVFPDRMLEAYPEMRGVDYPFCFSHPLVMRFLNAKIDEFFRRLPEVDGLNLTFAETRGYNILEHGGCRCEQCSRLSTDAKLRRVVLAMQEACRRNGKRLEVRSYNQLPAHAGNMRRALAKLAPGIPIVTKNTVVDFRGTGYPDNPLLGSFPGSREVMELTATPEGSGYGYIPALLGDFYRREIGEVATQRKLAGVAIRTDYHLQYGHATFFTDGPPVLTFDTPNGFNILAASRLAWDPSIRIADLWREWTAARYGAKAAPVERALRRTVAISQGIFFVKGFSLLTHLNMVPHLDTIDSELDNSYLLQFFPGNAAFRNVYGMLKNPSEDVLRDILAEKQAAADAAHLSAQELQSVDPPLARQMRTAENAALLWKRIAEVYFRLRRKDREPLENAVRSLVAESCRIEKEAGRVWPLYPAARGVTAYEFAQEVVEKAKLCCISTTSCP
ncbi:MAG: hypothetical protein ABIZ80_16655, partial [Bryobacteraceae bacterium]